MHLIVTGLNHKTTPLEIREQCAFSAVQVRQLYRELKTYPCLTGAMLLVTCNRTEVYAAVTNPDEGFALIEQLIAQHAKINHQVLRSMLYRYIDHQTVVHLFTVAAGLDSMVLGEQEILSQVKDAYRRAQEAAAVDRFMNSLVQTALHVGKKVRSETGISRYPVSVSAAAIELCREIFTSLDGKKVLVVGAGDAGRRAVTALMQSGAVSVIVSNRSYDHAVHMAAAVGGTAVHFDALAEELATADIVISCTAAPHMVIRDDNCGAVLRNRCGREIVMIDIAVPRDIDPQLAALPGVSLYDIDDLQNVVARHHKERLRAAHNARAILEREALRFAEKMSSQPVVPVIAALKKYAHAIADDELNKALHRLTGATDSQKRAEIVTSLAHSIANRLVHVPITRLKEKSLSGQAHAYAAMVHELFEVHNDDHAQPPQVRHARQ